MGGGDGAALLTAGAVTDCLVTLQRVPTPAIVAVAPAEGFHNRSQWVTVQGYGFIRRLPLVPSPCPAVWVIHLLACVCDTAHTHMSSHVLHRLECTPD